jgi:hypothetical protein
MRCSSCKESLPLSAFTPGVVTRSRGRCQACAKAYSKEHYLRNREKYLANMKKYNLMKLYGMTPEDYDSLLESQNGRCAICKAESGWVHRQSGGLKKLSVDHDHATGRVRGLLCDRCNTAIGKLNHDPNLLRAAIDYLAE